jgi:hypothetical protein
MPKKRGKVYHRIECRGCFGPLVHAATGRPRMYCSDKCRKRYHRRYAIYKPGYREDQAWRKADRTLRQWERASGPYDDTHPDGNPHRPSYRWRLQLYISRGTPVPVCHDCNRLFIQGEGAGPHFCSEKCSRRGHKMLKAVAEGLERYAGQVDPRVDLRLRIGMASEVKACPHCGIPFAPYNARRKYCSDRCRKAAWWKRNPHHACKVCSKPCKGQQTTCSDKCNLAHYRGTHTFCARCDRLVTPGSEVYPNAETRFPLSVKYGQKSQSEIIFCSYRCRDALGWSPTRKICEECRESYYPSAPNVQRTQRYCSPECRNRPKTRRNTQRVQATYAPVFCGYCSAPVPRITKPGGPSRYCSDDHQRLADLTRRRERKRARRALESPPV